MAMCVMTGDNYELIFLYYVKINHQSTVEAHINYASQPFPAIEYLGNCALRPSVVCNVFIVAKRCVLEQKLLLTAYRKSRMRNRLVPKWTTLTFI